MDTFYVVAEMTYKGNDLGVSVDTNASDGKQSKAFVMIALGFLLRVGLTLSGKYQKEYLRFMEGGVQGVHDAMDYFEYQYCAVHKIDRVGVLDGRIARPDREISFYMHAIEGGSHTTKKKKEGFRVFDRRVELDALLGALLLADYVFARHSEQPLFAEDYDIAIKYLASNVVHNRYKMSVTEELKLIDEIAYEF